MIWAKAETKSADEPTELAKLEKDYQGKKTPKYRWFFGGLLPNYRGVVGLYPTTPFVANQVGEIGKAYH